MAINPGYSSSVIPPNRMTSSADDEDQGYWSLAKCKRAYMDYVGSKRLEIEEQQNARAYRHGAQWTTGQVETFNRRRQPVVTYNRIGRKIDSVIGLMERQKQDPKAYPRNPRTTDENAAELATSVVRYVVESELRSDLFPFAIDQAAVDGYGGIELTLEQGDVGDNEIGFALVIGDSFFYDPRSYMHDFSDARYMGQGKWLDLEDAQNLFPDSADILEASLERGSDLTSNPDREKRWFDVNPDYKRVRVVDIYYKHRGGWCYTIFTGSAILMEGKSLFYDEAGNPICKYIMFSSFVDHEGDRYGFVRNLRSSQDEINQRRSKGLHELNSRRIKAEDGAFSDIEIARREAVRPDGVVIYNKGFEMEFDDQARIANVEGQLKFLEDAKAEIENFGPNPALIGQGLEYKSGRAINLLQQAGFAELGPFVIGVKNWKLRIYRAIWAAVQRYWTAERWIRVTDSEGLPQAVMLNGVGIDPRTGLPRMINAVGQLDVNFMLDEGPDEVNMMADAYDTLVALTAQGANIPPQILLELAPLQASVKKKLLGILEAPNPIQMQTQALELQAAQAKVAESQSKAQLNQAKAVETAQGGAHGIIERRMDSAMAVQQHQMKQAETAAKVQGDVVKAQIGAATQASKLRADQQKANMGLAMNAAKNAQQMMHTQQKHELTMRQQRQNGAGGRNATNQKSK